jgi:Skp family chaperone for outer membrane proteins
LAEASASAADAYLLADATADAALRLAADPAAAEIATHVIALTEGVVKAMILRKLKTLAGVLLAVSMTCGGAGVLWRSAVTTRVSAADPPSRTVNASAGVFSGDVFVASAIERSETQDLAGTSGTSAAPSPNQPAEAPPGPPPPAVAPPAGGGARALQTRIGLINLTRALKSSRRFQSFQADRRIKTLHWQKKLDALKTQLQQCQAEIDDPATPAGRREQSMNQVIQIKRQMEDEQATAGTLVAKMNADAFTTMYRDVEDAARRIAKTQGLELVLFYTDAVTEADFYNAKNLERKMSQPGALMPMIVSPGMDISETVIEALNRALVPPDGPRQ